jgi:putative nucleotidyltransferase with HDIG domain
MKIPTKEECIDLLHKYGISERKIEHLLLVEKVCLFVADKLIEKDIKIDKERLSRGALLHDIGKNSEKNHHKKGYDICKEEGIDECICKMVKKHGGREFVDSVIDNWEEKILIYIDKIVKNDIIGVEKRFDPWFKKAPGEKEILKQAKERIKGFEKEIFSHLDFKPGELKNEITN